MKFPKSPGKGVVAAKKAKKDNVMKGKTPAGVDAKPSRKDRPGGRPNLKSKPLTAKESNEKKKKKTIKSKKTLQKKEEDTSRKRLEKRETALKYLASWNTRTQGSQWKFSKKVQSFLINSLYDNKMISKDNFVILLEYLKDLKGMARTKLIEDAQVIYKNNSSALENTDKGTIPKNAKTKTSRSRKLIETLV